MVDSKNKTEPTIQLPTPTPDNPVVMAWKKNWGGEMIVAFHSPTSGTVLFDESGQSRGLRQMTNLIQFDYADYWDLYSGSLRLDIVTHYPAATPKPPVQTTPTPPSAGDGYRFLSLGETIEKGDEVAYGRGDWQPVEYTIGQSCQNPSAFRRPVVSQPAPGSDFRLLIIGEVIREGDEYWSEHEGAWFTTANPGLCHRGSNGPQPHYYRRRIQEPPRTAPAFPLPANQRKHAPGEGYRLLAPGETLLGTDEVGFHDSGQVHWRRTYHAGLKVGKNPCNCTYRRRVQSPGYRFLDPYEVVQRGDEMKLSDSETWVKMESSIGKQVCALGWTCRRKL